MENEGDHDERIRPRPDVNKPPEEPESDSSGIESLLETGASVAGAAAGAAIGLVAGPAGAVLGAAAGAVFERVLSRMAGEIRSRLLGPREEVRIGATLAYFIDTVQRRSRAGDRLRDDGFFDADHTGRSVGEEIFEATLLAGQREHEERKLRYLGRLLGNLAFEEEFDRAQCNLLIRTVEELSYRQLLLLQLFMVRGAATRERNYGHKSESVILPHSVSFVLTELFDLYNRGLVNNGTTAAFSLIQMVPAQVETQGIGHTLISLVGLTEVEDGASLNELTRILSEDPGEWDQREDASPPDSS